LKIARELLQRTRGLLEINLANMAKTAKVAVCFFIAKLQGKGEGGGGKANFSAQR
jgi:hypothetical protein